MTNPSDSSNFLPPLPSSTSENDFTPEEQDRISELLACIHFSAFSEVEDGKLSKPHLFLFALVALPQAMLFLRDMRDLVGISISSELFNLLRAYLKVMLEEDLLPTLEEAEAVWGTHWREEQAFVESLSEDFKKGDL